MAHSDVLIFLTNITWVFFLFLFVYFFFVTFFLPTFYKKIRIRQTFKKIFAWARSYNMYTLIGSYAFVVDAITDTLKKNFKLFSSLLAAFRVLNNHNNITDFRLEVHQFFKSKRLLVSAKKTIRFFKSYT